MDQSSGFSYPFSHLFAWKLSPSKADCKAAFTSQFSFVCLPYGNSAMFTQTKWISENKHRIVAWMETYVLLCLNLLFCGRYCLSLIINTIILIEIAYTIIQCYVVKQHAVHFNALVLHVKSKSVVIWWDLWHFLYIMQEYNEKGGFKRSNKIYLPSYSVEERKKKEKKRTAEFEIQTPVCPFHPSCQKFRVVYQVERLKTRDTLKFHCF